MKFKVNKKMLLQEDVVMDALLHNGGTGEELPNKSIMDTIKDTLPSAPHINLSDKLSTFKNSLSNFAHNVTHGQNALGDHAISAQKEMSAAAEYNQNRDNVLNKTGIDINNSLYTDPEKLHQNLSNAVPPKEPLKTIFNDPNAQIDNLQSHVTKLQEPVTKYENTIEALKHPYGDKFLGSQTIANKLNNMTPGQQLTTAAGTGAILGTGGHILGSTLSKRLRGADKK